MGLTIKDETAVTLEGYVDSNRQLQFRYGNEELSEHDDSVVVYSDDPVRVTLSNPAGFTIAATHDEGRNTVHWDSSAAGVFHSFSSSMTDPVQVEAEAEPNLPKNVFIHIKQTGGLPDT